LSETGTGHSDDGRKLNLQINVTTITLADTIVGYTIISATILFVDGVQFENVASVRCTTCSREEGRKIIIIFAIF
jgi:hypothetical protein